ncbi:MAG: DUF4878 domain-containing protein [Planctomycetes bacterium]|nr:DUF4878 domain-containing protein [Planctomycetota bacterium]
MKKLAPLLLLFLLIAACGGDEGSDTPEEAVTRFIEALQSGDPEDIYAAVHRREGESFQKSDERMDWNRWDYCNIEEFSIGEAVLDGNRAKVTIHTKREVGEEIQEQDELVVCIQENKKWKVTMSGSSPLFLPPSKKPD